VGAGPFEPAVDAEAFQRGGLTADRGELVSSLDVLKGDVAAADG
jgi:hypothetical protein